MNHTCIFCLSLLIAMLPTGALAAPPPKPVPTHADVSYGPNPHQLMDIHLPANGRGPFPVLIWYGGLWAPSKGVPDLNKFLPVNCAVVGVQMRTMQDAIQEKISPPISVCLLDARRAVQFVRLHAAEWNLDPERIAVGGSSQGAFPALYVGCAGERADPNSTDPVERVSTKVVCVAAHRTKPTIDPKRMQEWDPGVEWGAPALGCSFAESLEKREELLPIISQWSPESLLSKDTPPPYFEHDWGLTKPETVGEMDYKVHSPRGALGFQKLAQEQGVTCYVKFPDHPSEKYADIWDFLVTDLTQPPAGFLRAFVDRHTVAGVVALVATKDKVLSLDAVGWADIAAKRPMQTDCLFGIASMSKPMTATALMMLVDKGKVSVEDPVEKYLPEFKGQMVIAEKDVNHVLLKKPNHPLLVREILSHTGGLLYSSPMETPTLDRLPLCDAVRSHAILPLQFDPGTKFMYSSAGVNTAARIVEVVSRMPFEQFMAERIFRPLGMQDTTFVPTEEQLQRLAKLYMSNKATNDLEETTAVRFTYPLSNPNRQPIPGSGLFSTASDVGRFCQMILNGGVFEGKRYLTEASVKEMTSRQTPASLQENYGFCWNIEKDGVGHGGSFRTFMSIDTTRGQITVFLTQQNNEWLNEEGNSMWPMFKAEARKMAGVQQ